MEKNMQYPAGDSEPPVYLPSAPPPSAPPSYEETVANSRGMHLPGMNTVPYPVGPTPMPMPMASGLSELPMRAPPYPVGPPGMRMPMPTVVSMPMPASYNTPPNQTTMPVPPNYTLPPGAASQSQAQRGADPNLVEVRVIHHNRCVLSPNPVKMTCPTCQADIKTTTISDHQPSAHICCIVLCLLGCCLCSCLPYCMNVFRSVHHFCPNCKNYIGTWKG